MKEIIFRTKFDEDIDKTEQPLELFICQNDSTVFISNEYIIEFKKLTARCPYCEDDVSK